MSNQHDYMDSRMLHAFMDGELGGAQEEVLFMKLSSDPGLRSEMQDHIAIRKAIQHDIEAFTAPASATTAIFATLGFTIPAASATAASVGSSAAGFTELRNMGFGLGSAIVATVAAVLLYLQFPMPFDAFNRVAERVVSAPASTVVLEEAMPLADIPVANPSHGSDRPGTSVLPEYAAAPSSTPVSMARRDVSARDIAFLAEAMESMDAPDRVHENQVRFFDLIPAPDGITLHARNIAMQSDPSPTVVSQSDSWFSNMNLGVTYALGEHHAIGIETGREAFSQHFFGAENGVRVRYEQNPLAYWATAVYQFTGGALLPHVHPFVQLQGGGAFELGPLARATLGLKLKPFDRIAVVVGAEGSILLYRFQNNWFSTNKLGLTYGVSYEF